MIWSIIWPKRWVHLLQTYECVANETFLLVFCCMQMSLVQNINYKPFLNMKSVANLRLLAEWICQAKVMIRSPLEKMNYLCQEYRQAFAWIRIPILPLRWVHLLQTWNYVANEQNGIQYILQCSVACKWVLSNISIPSHSSKWRMWRIRD